MMMTSPGIRSGISRTRRTASATSMLSPKCLAEWLKATDEDVFLEDHEEDDKPQE
jgi:hypothetical protein